MTRFRANNASNLRDVADGIVRHLDRVSDRGARGGAGHDVSEQPRVPAGSGRESGQWTAEGGEGGPPIETITIKGHRPLTDDQIAAIIFNETQALHGPDLHQARIDMAATIMNADEVWGGHRSGLARTAPDQIMRTLNPDERRILAEIHSAIDEARQTRDSGKDPTNHATNFDIPYSVDKSDPEWRLKKGYTEERGYRDFWDANRNTPRSIRILQNSVASRPQPK